MNNVMATWNWSIVDMVVQWWFPPICSLSQCIYTNSLSGVHFLHHGITENLNCDLPAFSIASGIWATCETEHVSPYFVFTPVNEFQSVAVAFLQFLLPLLKLLIEFFILFIFCCKSNAYHSETSRGIEVMSYLGWRAATSKKGKVWSTKLCVNNICICAIFGLGHKDWNPSKHTVGKRQGYTPARSPVCYWAMIAHSQSHLCAILSSQSSKPACGVNCEEETSQTQHVNPTQPDYGSEP